MIFALVGSEVLLVKRALDKLLSERLEPASKDFNCDIFEANDLSAKKVAEAIGSLPMLAARRVVLIRNAHELKKAEQEALSSLLSQVPETTDLILVAEKSDGRTLFWQKLKEEATIREFKPLDPREAPRWVVEEGKHAGYAIEPMAAQALVNAVGSDLSALQSTMEKLYLLKGDQKKISLADVEGAVVSVSWRSIFDLTNAVGARKLDEALRLYQKMQESGESPIALLALLARHFRILSRVKEGDSGGVPPFFLKDYQSQASQFDGNRLTAKREKIFQTDWQLKSSPIDSNLVFERLLMELCR